VHVHSHVSESKDEVAWVRRLFPKDRDYLGVYERHGLVGPRALFAHGVHLTAGELRRLHQSGAAIAHCPTSNLFLGSGLFRLHGAKDRRRPVHVALGTDVGAGTSFSILQTLNEAYKVARLLGECLTVEEAFFLATLGGARALRLDDRIGSLAPGREADLVVLDPRATPEMALVAERAESVLDLLFALMTLGDSRAVRVTYVAGARASRVR
jgi:guanine deaminase